MDRRQFLNGIFAGVTTSGLIVKASNAEVQRFAQQQAVGAPVAVLPPSMTDGDGMLYDRHGTPVALVVKLDVRTEHMDYDRNDGVLHAIPGIRHLSMEVVPVCDAQTLLNLIKKAR